MTVRIDTSLDCTPAELIEDLANMIYQSFGTTRFPLKYFMESQHPTERSCLQVAEKIFELFTGDLPDYADYEEISGDPPDGTQ